MYETENELRLRVSKDRIIRIESAPDEFRTESCPIELSDDENDTGRQTVKAFIEMLAENRLRKESEFQLLGALLYGVLFDNQIGDDLHRAVEENRATYLRVVLQFEKDELGLAGWPWEYLYCPKTESREQGGYFLTRSENLLLSRRPPGAQLRSFRVERPPVTVLFVASRPVGSPVRWEQVLDKIEKDVRIRVVALLPDPGDSPVPGSTYETFLSTLKSEQPHVIHFVGHGDFHDGHGRVMFMNKDGSARPITDATLAQDIWDIARSAVRLVFIQACESARSEQDALLDRYQAVSGIASNLAAKGVPAIVAMQYAIDQDFAEVFACTFYEALADAKPVDIAVHEARQAVKEAERLDEQRREDDDSQDSPRPAFALPVLYWTRPDAVFPSVEAGPSAPPDDAQEAMRYCIWCSQAGGQTEIDANDNFCGAGHPVRCRAPDPNRPGGICAEPVRRAATHCVQCGQPLPLPQFESGESEEKKRISLTPVFDRAAGKGPT